MCNYLVTIMIRCFALLVSVDVKIRKKERVEKMGNRN